MLRPTTNYKSCVTIAGIILGLSAATTGSADVKDPDPVKDKPKFVIVCAGENNDYKCTLVGADGSTPSGNEILKPGDRPPNSNKQNDRALIVITAGADPDGTPKPEHGKHCWVQIGGTWTSVHC